MTSVVLASGSREDQRDGQPGPDHAVGRGGRAAAGVSIKLCLSLFIIQHSCLSVMFLFVLQLYLFLPMHLPGRAGVPRRTPDHPDAFAGRECSSYAWKLPLSVGNVCCRRSTSTCTARTRQLLQAPCWASASSTAACRRVLLCARDSQRFLQSCVIPRSPAASGLPEPLCCKC